MTTGMATITAITTITTTTRSDASLKSAPGIPTLGTGPHETRKGHPMHDVPITNTFWPMVVEQTNRGERGYDLPSRLLKERIIFVTGGIDDQVAASICMQLLY